MRVIIPVAGIGTRLRPHTYTVPKALLHVAGKPILAFILDSVVRYNPDEVVIVTGFMGEKIQEYVSRNYGFRMRYVEQTELLGLGHAVREALMESPEGPTLIILGDTIVDTDMDAFLRAGENVLGLMPVDDPSRFGIAEVEADRVINLVEKPAEPKSNLAIIGLYFVKDGKILKDHLDRLVFEDRKTRGEYQLTDALQSMIEAGVGFKAFSVDGWYDCGKKETMIATNRYLLEKMASSPDVEGSVVVPPVYVAPSAIVESSIIGPFVSVSDRAIVRQSIIRNSIVGYKAVVENALLADSLIGQRAKVSGDFEILNTAESSETKQL